MALVTIRRSPSVQTPKNTEEVSKSPDNIDENDGIRTAKSINECYFTNKGAALVLGGSERAGRRRSPPRAQPQPQPDIQHHLQSMFYLLRPEETLKMAVKLESAHAGRTRYLVVVCRGEEAALLGIDCNHRTTVGLVLRVLADTAIKLDGDGGFSVCVCGQQHIFKPVSVQAMWSALQTLHRASGRARACNHFAGGASHAWAAHYEARVDSDRSCLNEWHAMDCLESRRPPSPDSLRHKPRERDETERVIRCTLKEIMTSVDLDEVTSKAIRGRLEDDLDMDLAEYKSFIDQEMLTILGQMDAPTEIFDHVYLGSEWNASNLEELRRNGVQHILNVTREIDNFFPGMFNYLNVRVYDDEKTDLLKHWDNTYKYINKAKKEGSKVLVHCKMGISRSASVVIAYAMKAFDWNFDKALRHVKGRRSCIKPNTNFLNQLETYQGILEAMKNKEKLQRSKSETNLKSPKLASKIASKIMDPTPLIQALTGSFGGRPRSWSPDSKLASELLPPTSVSLENLVAETRHMLMPCANGSYSVSPNQIMRLKEENVTSVKHIIHEIENAATADRKDINRRSIRLNFGVQSDAVNTRSVDAVDQPNEASKFPTSPSKYQISNSEGIKIHTWDPGESGIPKSEISQTSNCINKIGKCDGGASDAKSRSSDEEVAASARSSRSDLSRHSSWGSGDARAASVAVAVTVDNKRRFDETCAILRELTESVRSRGAATWSGRLSASAPTESWLRGGLRRRRPASASHGDLPRARERVPPAGLVRNLKKEFEARAGDADRPRPPVERRALDDLCVRVLVDRYDSQASAEPVALPATPATPAPAAVFVKPAPESTYKKCKLNSEGAKARGAPPFLRNSFCGALRGASCAAGERPPPAPHVVAMAPLDYPNVVLSTVMSKAQNKKQLQHGKTHPLTRLNLNRSNNRCSNPVYNTM